MLLYRENKLELTPSTFDGFVALIYLDLSFNAISVLKDTDVQFISLKQLFFLNISHNSLQTLTPMAFNGLASLRYIDISHNPITTIRNKALQGMKSLTSLALINMQVSRLYSCSFCGLDLLKHLDMTNNSIDALPDDIFNTLENLVSLKISLNPIYSIGKTNVMFYRYLDLVEADRHSLCCISRKLNRCSAMFNDVFTTCQDLLGNTLLRYAILFICGTSVIANALVLLFRVHSKKRLTSENLLIINLAVSDILSPIYMYLSLLSVADMQYKGIFISVSYTWWLSTLCKAIAVLSTVCTNMSLHLLTFLTINRAVHILYNHKVSTNTAASIISLGWFINLFIAVIPLSNLPYFGGSYIHTDACLLFNFTTGMQQGWLYGFFFFFLFNMIMIVLMAIFYAAIVRKTILAKAYFSKEQTISALKKRSSSLVTSMLILAGSNLVMWLPIFSLYILSLVDIDIPSVLSR